MRRPLPSAAMQFSWVLASLLLVAPYLWFVHAQFLAAHFAERSDLLSLQRAVRWQPGNAGYHNRVGRHLFLIERSPQEAIESYREALARNPHQARYWFDLAAAYQLLGNTGEQRDALEHATSADPTTPDFAWEAANLYLTQGDLEKALAEFRVVMENDPYLPSAALQFCWRVKPDIDALLRDVVPHNSSVYTAFLEFLTSRKETAAADKVWARMVEAGQPVEARYVFEYMRYLIGQHQVDQARLVWRQAASLCGLQAYQPSAENLVINGDFSLNVLNGGFDWLYEQSKDVSLALDPLQSHSGQRSLLITFDSRGTEDAGIRQLIPVTPNTSYEFSAYFKAQDIQGAGGPRFALQDLYSQATYFASDELKDADFWKPVGGSFTTGPDTQLLMIRVQRIPAGSPIRGKLWIDGVRLIRKEP